MNTVTLEQVFNRSESIEYSNTFNYIEQEAINGKNSIVSGNETLKKYPLTVKLHHSWCNPQEVIEEIEEKAKNREIINYFQKGKYIGDYVIDNYNVKVNQILGDVIIYAELEINLLENPDSVTEFEQQTKVKPEIDLPIIGENSNKMKKFLMKVKDTIRTNVFDIAITSLRTGDISRLSDAGKLLFNNLESQIVTEIKNAGLSKAFDIVQKYTDNLDATNVLSETENEIVKAELGKIPNTIINAAIRSV